MDEEIQSPITLSWEEIDTMARAICGFNEVLSEKLNQIKIIVDPLVYPIVRAVGIQRPIPLELKPPPDDYKVVAEKTIGREATKLLIRRVNKIAANFA